MNYGFMNGFKIFDRNKVLNFDFLKNWELEIQNKLQQINTKTFVNAKYVCEFDSKSAKTHKYYLNI
jgi:hypothetical protein